MYIVNTIYQLIRELVTKIRRNCCAGAREQRIRSDEEDLLLASETDAEVSDSDRSLTADFQDYARSKDAMILFLCHASAYYSLAVLGFSYLVEKHSVRDSLYLASVTFTTIGFGDVEINNAAGRVYLIFLATYGIVILGIFLGVLGDIIVESQSTISVERKRKLQRLILGTIGSREGHRGAHVHPPFEPPVPLIKDIASVAVMEAPIVLFVVFLGIMVGWHEGWSVVDSVYWTAVSSYTIGFGDYHPQSASTRWFCVFFLPFSVAVIGEVLGRIASVYMDRKRNHAEERFLQKSLTVRDLRTLDLNSDGKVTKAEFLSYMLVSLQKVAREDIDELLAVFNRLDTDKSGALTMDDLVGLSATS
ncbi:hypothetical protein MPSEU_000203500 [Mayamaea pseudoterrestris]|nr:hypothetical protein MPSEU_000203500 [Mayamaea pseudoterrestris]